MVDVIGIFDMVKLGVEEMDSLGEKDSDADAWRAICSRVAASLMRVSGWRAMCYVLCMMYDVVGG